MCYLQLVAFAVDLEQTHTSDVVFFNELIQSYHWTHVLRGAVVTSQQRVDTGTTIELIGGHVRAEFAQQYVPLPVAFGYISCRLTWSCWCIEKRNVAVIIY